MLPKTLLIALLFLTSLNFTYLSAQDSGCTRRTVAVGVVDREWNLVQGLSAANFRGRLHGRDVEVLSASVNTSPRHIVLLLDASGSMMGGSGKWDTAKSLSEDLIRFAPPRASIAQMAFTDNVLDTAAFEQDRLTLLKRLAALVKVSEQSRQRRDTALYDAISSGLSALGSLDFGDVIYAVTDGGDNTSEIPPERVEQDLLRAGVRLFSVLTDSGRGMRGRVSEKAEGPNRLLFMVETTGGNMLTLPYGKTSRPNPHIKARTRSGAVDLALHRLYQQMGEFYRLDLRLPETVDKPTSWKLEVIHADGRPSPQVKVRYPQQLMPCARANP
jgi:hypothetical protein